MQVFFKSGGVGCEDFNLIARLRSLRVSPHSTAAIISKVGKDALETVNGTFGPFYDFSIELVSDAGTSVAVVLKDVTILKY